MSINPKNEIIKHFEKYIKVSDTLKTELLKRITLTTFKKGELIHTADIICVKSYFIQKGLVRIYFLKEGKEVSEYFCAESEWVNSPRSFTERKLDIYYIDAIEKTDALCLHVNDLVYLLDNFPEMERYSRLSMGTILEHLMKRIASLQFTSAKEKYDYFCEEYKDIYTRIPLGMVASYLGITQETLSRIRAEK